jgi:hypothetical protein
MRQYNVFENGAPFPGTCVGCRSNIKLFDLGVDLMSGGNAMLCLQCINDLAEFTGQAPKQPLLNEIAALKAEIVSRETELAKVPDLVEGLINGIRSSVTDFVFAVSYSDSVSGAEPVQQPEPSKPRPNKIVKDAKRDNQASEQSAFHERPHGVPTNPSRHS